MNYLCLNNINKSYGRKTRALCNINLTLAPGVWGMLGPNGAGKTTLLRILSTVLSPDSGSISMGNITWDKPSEVRQLIGYVPQHFGMYPLVTVQEALEHIALLKGVAGGTLSTCITRVLKQVNLYEQKHKRIKELSGGMIKRLAIAQAILTDPMLLIFDEPTAGLDPEERIRFRDIISQIAQGKTIIISTHIVPDVLAVCQSAVIIDHGNILACDTVDNLVNLVPDKAKANATCPLESAYMYMLHSDGERHYVD